MKWLVYGANGWIGNMVVNILRGLNRSDPVIVICGKARADNDTDVEEEIISHKPDRIISLIGRTRGDNFMSIDYLEQKGKLVENLRDNLFGPIIIANIAIRYQIHFTYLGTGCIFNGYNNDIGFDESAKPNFFGSSYSVVKGYTDRLMHTEPYNSSCLNVRIRMPITSDHSDKNFITKILNYKKICSIPNSMTVLPELLPIMIDMAEKKITGTINLTNPGLISHNEILTMYKEIVNPNFTWENFSLEEQQKILLSERSNDLLNTDLLQKMYPDVLPIKDSVRRILIEMAE